MSGEAAPTPPPEQEQKPDEPPPPGPAVESASGPPAAEEKPLSWRALVLTGHGGYDKIKLQVKTRARQPPPLREGELLVRVKACGLNFAELIGKQGLYELLPPPPVTLGMEGSGVVEAVGDGVLDRKVSERTRARIMPPSGAVSWEDGVLVFNAGVLMTVCNLLLIFPPG